MAATPEFLSAACNRSDGSGVKEDVNITDTGTHDRPATAGRSERNTEVTDWQATYESSYRTMLRVAYSLTGSAAAAEDAVHDAFCSVGPKIVSLDDPVPYLRVAVVNRCRTMHGTARRAEAFRALERPTDTTDIDTGLINFGDALDRLTFPQRTAVVLRYLCDVADDEIAHILNCRRSTVRSHIRRGLAQLRNELSEDLS